ncbi:MAG: helix-hairpin-helix domain-containing protein [Myxococcales bacterium]|nr:helix-hairpin-helix domain-containing protein [Myxococcales bacterium]
MVAVTPLTRTGWLGVVALLCLAAGVALRLWWPSSRPALDCPPEEVRWKDGVARCEGGPPLTPAPAGAGLTVGLKLDLNRATEHELGLVPGIGPKLARELVSARGARGGFKSWDEVDDVPGVGGAKLEALRSAAEIR